MNIALCFCVRNCEEYLKFIFKNIELMKTLNNINVFSIFIYDNCSDNSGDILENYKNNNNNVIVKHIENKSNYRTKRIAKARNACLKIVYSELPDIVYHIMIDSDNVCSLKWDIDIINKYLNNFDNDNWDCISFNNDNYYDIWALMFDNFKYDCWGFGLDSRNVINIMQKCIIEKLNNCKTNSIDVISAFNGFSIYKTDKFKEFYYDGTYNNFKNLITKTDIIDTLNNLKKYNINVSINNNNQICEHLFYNISAFKKGCKIKISKFKIMNKSATLQQEQQKKTFNSNNIIYKKKYRRDMRFNMIF